MSRKGRGKIMNNIFVDPNKKTDVKNGIFNTVFEAIDNAEPNTRITFSNDVHYIDRPIVLDKREGLCFEAENAAVISSNRVLDNSKFEKDEKNGYYTYKFEKENGAYPLFRDLYVNGERKTFAESEFSVLAETIPNEKDRSDPENINGLYIDASLLSGADFDDLYPAEFFLHLQWEMFFLHAERLDSSDTIEREGKTYTRLIFKEDEFNSLLHGYHTILSLKNRPYCMRNHKCLVKNGGDFAYDFTRGILYYMPENEDEIKNAVFEYPVLDRLFEITDSSDIRFDSLTFTGISNKYGLCEEYLSYQANTLADHAIDDTVPRKRIKTAAIVLKNTAEISIMRCGFDSLGTNGVLFYDRSKNISITDCDFDDIAMSAIVIGNATVSWNDVNRSENIRIENNTVSNIGFYYPSAPAITVLQCDNTKILHNSIDNTAYSALSVGWGWEQVPFGYGEKVNIKSCEIAYNRFEHFMQVLKDGGAVYVVGANCVNTFKPTFNSIHDNFILRGDDEPENAERGIYLDGASSNWHVHSNVGTGCRFPLFIQYHVVPQYTYNNFAEHNYWTKPFNKENTVPERNVFLKDNKDGCESLEKMFEEYPESKYIADASGIYR